MLLPQFFVALFIYLTLIDAFCYYSFCFMLNVFNLKLICARNRAGWAVYPYGLLPTLCNSNMLDHINLLNLKFLMFLYFHQHAKNFCYLMLFFFPLLHLCYLMIRVTTMHEYITKHLVRLRLVNLSKPM